MPPGFKTQLEARLFPAANGKTTNAPRNGGAFRDGVPARYPRLTHSAMRDYLARFVLMVITPFMAPGP
jgi:hypothetical protein